jgi:2,3-dihydroxyphenylpropionate 1,2-dioxygenase
MTDIIGFVGMSRSPIAAMLTPGDPSWPGSSFLADSARVATAVTRLAPDAVVVIGPASFSPDYSYARPAFVLGIDEADSLCDCGGRTGPLPVAAPLARAIWHGLANSGFDLSLSCSLSIDRTIVQSYELLSGGIPLVPLMVNTTAPPLPSMGSCALFGSALGAAIRAAAAPGRVLVVASGGLSRWHDADGPRDPALVGKHHAASDPATAVNLAWDEWFLRQLATADLAPVAALGDRALEKVAGSGGREIRSWLIGGSAVREPVVWTSYESVPEWIAGMAIGTTFEPG